MITDEVIDAWAKDCRLIIRSNPDNPPKCFVVSAEMYDALADRAARNAAAMGIESGTDNITIKGIPVIVG
jgi:hypothetical protein